MNFLLDIFNDKITFKKAEINQRDLNKKTEELKYNYKPKNGKEKEEINEVLMHANDTLEYGDKIIDVFKNGTFLSEHLKKSDDAAHDLVLEDVNKFIQKIELIAEKIDLGLFEDFFESSSPANYAKTLINTKNPNENKEIVVEIKDRVSNLKENERNEQNRKKKKNPDETLKIIKEILDYNKNAQKFFLLASKVDKGKSEPKFAESIATRVHLKREKIAKIEEEEKNINNELFKKYFTNYRSPSDMYKTLRETEGKKIEDQVYLIQEVLNGMKKNYGKGT